MGLITESKRRSMTAWGSFLCFLCLGPSLGLIAAGSYAKIAVESKIRLIEGFNTAALPGVIIFLGLYCVVHNLAAGSVLLSVRKPKMRKRKSCFLLPGVVMGLVLFLCLFVMSMISFGQTMYLEKSFDKGIVRAMKNYKTNRTLKAEIDNLQIDFKCCGNNRYTDWFKVSWIKEDYVNYNNNNKRKPIRSGGYKNDDVPFSCCDATSPRPCINHHVHDNDMHYSYDYRSKTTLYKQGCRESLVNFYGKQLMMYVGLTLLGVSGFQFIVVLLTRFLQTSIAKALELGDPEAATVGYFFSHKEEKKKGGKGESKSLLDDDEDDEDGEDPPEEDEDPPEEDEDNEEEEPPEDEEEEDAEEYNEDWGEEYNDDDEEYDDNAPPRRRHHNRNRSNPAYYGINNNQMSSDTLARNRITSASHDKQKDSKYEGEMKAKHLSHNFSKNSRIASINNSVPLTPVSKPKHESVFWNFTDNHKTTLKSQRTDFRIRGVKNGNISDSELVQQNNSNVMEEFNTATNDVPLTLDHCGHHISKGAIQRVSQLDLLVRTLPKDCGRGPSLEATHTPLFSVPRLRIVPFPKTNRKVNISAIEMPVARQQSPSWKTGDQVQQLRHREVSFQ